MFTGIIKELGTIKRISPLKGGKELVIEAALSEQLAVDHSISINGVCHTVTEHSNQTFTVQSVEETLRKTTIGSLGEGDSVNLEPSLKADQLLDGHLVQGHVDTVVTLKKIEYEGDDRLFSFEYPETAKDLIVGRGSVAIDGISLTVAREEGQLFTVAVIPFTYNHTNLKYKKEGDAANIEFDIFGKYVVRYLQNREA